MTVENYGSYQLLKRLATGGMAQIYLARERGPEGFEKHLVVKRILPHLAENVEFVRMFLDEARIAARLNHPNIVQIFRLGAEGDSYFIAMEYIHGEDVRRVWKRADSAGKSMPIALVCRVIMDACSGLDYAHKLADAAGKPLGIVHRDISPQNILVTFEGGVKVVDFGIAKAADQATVTKSGVLKGKYSYMSPEQASGRKLDCRSDIFALGVVLHELLTGQRLFKRQNDIQTLHAVTECEVPLPSQVNPRLPKDLDPVVMKALARDPHDRYPDAIALQLALEDWLLQHQLPSSSAHLAAFMQELYAERLAEERKAGQLLVEELDAQRVEEEAGNGPSQPTPQSRSRRSPPSESRQLHARADARLTEQSLPAVSLSGTDSESTTAERFGSRGGTPIGLPHNNPALVSLLSSAQDAPPRRSGQHPLSRAADTVPPGMDSLDGGDTHSVSAGDESDESDDSIATTHSTDLSAGRKRIRRRFPILAVTIGASAALIVGLGAYVLGRRAPQIRPVQRPVVAAKAQDVKPREVKRSAQLVSSPAGAAVTVDGTALAEVTPCEVALLPGTHTLVLRKDGFREMALPVDVPQEGAFSLPVAVLEPQTDSTSVAGAAVNAAGTSGSDSGGAGTTVAAKASDAVPSQVHVTFRSEPAATLFLQGEAKGRTPQTLTLPANAVVSLRLERAGYQTVSDSVNVGATDRDQVFVLQKAVRGARAARERTDAREERAMGKVRFVVSPWANVTCGGQELGQTPLPDKELPVGSYECRFTNPELGARTAHVEVKANAVSKVPIKF